MRDYTAARHRIVARATAAEAEVARLREALNKVWTLKHVYEAQLDEFEVSLDVEDAVLVSGLVESIRDALAPQEGA